MIGDENTDSADVAAGAGRKRFRSEIEFPYADLENAIDLTQTLHSKAGNSCELEELAAWMNQTAAGGTFRSRVSAAKLFGLVDTGQGRVTLMQLGHNIVEGSGSERAARIQAFLNVELFAAMYERYKGHILPPAAAIERQMVDLGVSPKQKERARQTFIKSAQQASFIDQSSGRFIKPGNAGHGESAGTAKGEAHQNGGGGGGGEPPDVDPIIQGLLARLPKSGEVWPVPERQLWLQLLEGSFKLIYKDKSPDAPDES